MEEQGGQQEQQPTMASPPTQQPRVGSDGSLTIEQLVHNYNELVNTGMLLIDEKEFFMGIQEKGQHIAHHQRASFANKRKLFIIKGDRNAGDHVFKKIYTLASLIADKCKEHKQSCFPKLAKKSNIIPKICGWIHTKRYEVGRSDVNSGTHPATIEFVQTLPPTEKRVYLLEQKRIYDEIFSLYGANEVDLMKPTQNDRARIFGLLLTQGSLRDLELPLLLESKKQIRAESDHPGLSKTQAMSRLHLAFTNEDIKVDHPAKWPDALNKHAAWGRLNPNDVARIQLPWDAKEIEKMFSSTLSEYRKCMDKFTKDTGGGSGDETDFVTWSERDDLDVANYNQEDALLTWIYMLDKQFSFCIVKKKQGLPFDLQIDIEISDEEGGTTRTPRRRASSLTLSEDNTSQRPKQNPIEKSTGILSAALETGFSGVGGAMVELAQALKPAPTTMQASAKEKKNEDLAFLLDTGERLVKSINDIEEKLKGMPAGRRKDILQRHLNRLYDELDNLESGPRDDNDLE